MERIFQFVTIAVFAAHALLGCGVHYSCRHNPVREICSEDHVETHDCTAHHDSESHEPCEEHVPSAPCSHVSCNFVKAESVRIDQGCEHVEWMAAATPVESAQLPQVFLVANEPLCTADISSTPVYVWHCALVI